MTSQSPTFESAEALLHYMIARVTDGGEIDVRAYKQARAAVLGDRLAEPHAPPCVRICREPDAVWSYIKGREGLDTYASRRQYLRAEFEPLFTTLEHFESSPLEALVEQESAKLDAESVTAAWRKALARLGNDPEGAITAARALLESVCKTILDDSNAEYATGDDMPKLYRRVQKVLSLSPSNYTEEQFRRILGGCTSVVEGLGSVRNREGDSHGKGRKSYRPAARHAALAVNLAGSMALFLMQTHEAALAESAVSDDVS